MLKGMTWQRGVWVGISLFACLWLRRFRKKASLDVFNSYTEAEQVVREHVRLHGNLSGRVYIVTGANDGLGLETARVLALAEADVVLACRSEERARAAIVSIQAGSPQALKLHFLPLDLTSFTSVRRFAQLFADTRLPLHGLVNNAGVYHLHSHTLGEDGYELTWTVNYLSPWLLTLLLSKQLRAQPDARVVNVSSRMHESARFYNFWFGSRNAPWKMCTQSPTPEEYGQTWAYARTKVANIMHAHELSLRWPSLRGYSVEPGLVRTNMTRNQSALLREFTYALLSPIVKTTGQGAATTVCCLLQPQLRPGYYANCAEADPLSGCFEHANTRALWELSEKCTAAT